MLLNGTAVALNFPASTGLIIQIVDQDELQTVNALLGTARNGAIAGEVFSVLWNTTLQRKIPPQMLSRVSAYDHLGSMGLAPLGIVLAGFLFESLGHRTTLLIAVVFVIVPSLMAIAVRDVRTLTRSPQD